jgi:hypothetical protein
MRTPAKVGLVATGYVGAFLVAFAVVAIHVALTSGPDWQASSGMYAFGDSLLFLAVFTLASIPAAGAALFFLRPYRMFWRAFSLAALAIAATGLVALIDYVAQRTALGPWSVLAVLRILLAPTCALTFLLSGLFAPNRSTRIALFAATLIEATVIASVAAMLFDAYRR